MEGKVWIPYGFSKGQRFLPCRSLRWRSHNREAGGEGTLLYTCAMHWPGEPVLSPAPPDNQLGLESASGLEAGSTRVDTYVEEPSPKRLFDSPEHTDLPPFATPPRMPWEDEEEKQGPSAGALDRRLRRLLAPNAKGEYKVAEDVRKLWDEGQKDEVLRLFAKCDNDPKKFVKQHSVKSQKEKEVEVGVFFKFLVEEDFKEKPENLFSDMLV